MPDTTNLTAHNMYYVHKHMFFGGTRYDKNVRGGMTKMSGVLIISDIYQIFIR